MDQLRRAIGACLVAVLSLSGCTVTAPRPLPTRSSVSAPPTPLPTSVVADPIGGERVVFQRDSQRGGYSVDLPVTSDRVHVYLRCIGSGVLHVDLADVAAYDYTCVSGSDPGELDSFDVRYVDELRVRISPDGDQLWAVTVTAVPLDD